jgi:cytochrome P450
MKLLTEIRLGATTLAMRSMVRGMALTGDPVARVLARKAAEDPYPLYERIRARGDIARHPIGLHVTADFATCRSVLRDNDFYVEPAVRHGGIQWAVDEDDEYTLAHPMEQSLLMLNPPGHTRLRRIAAPCFTPNAMREYTPRVEAIAKGFCDQVADRAEFDLVSEFAARVPIEVVRDLFDTPDGDREQFLRWGSVLAGTLDGIRTLAERRAVHRAVTELTAFLDEKIRERRDGSGTDVISRIARAEVDGLRPNGRDLVALAGLLLVAGFETTINVISEASVRLMREPSLVTALAEDPDLAPAVVEETLRIEPPVQFTLRKPSEATVIEGHALPKDSMLVLLLAGANRDPKVFPDPARFDPFRENSRDHLAFSAGIHYCLGAGLARIEAAAALRTLFGRMPTLTLAGPVSYKRTRNIRGCAQVPVRQA